MKSAVRIAAALSLFAAGLLAQGVSTVYFSTRFTETPASNRAGDNISVVAPCGGLATPGPLGNYTVESALANYEGVTYVEPGVLNATVPFTGPTPVLATDYVEIANFAQFNLIIGDLDANGIPEETAKNFPGIDAIYIPTAALHPGRRCTIHDMFISSFGDSTGSLGYLGVTMTEADLVMLPRASNVYPAPSGGQAPIFFIRQSDWEAFFNLAVPNNAIDVDAFAVDESNGDIYVSFDGISSSNSNCFANAQVRTAPGGPLQTVTITRGDIIRVPGTAYTPSGPYAIVTLPVGGQAEIVYTAAQVQAMVLAAGGTIAAGTATNPVNTYALDLDPIGGTTITPNGFTVAHLLFTVDNRGGPTGGVPPISLQNPSSTAIYTTVGGGLYAQINGVTMNSPNAAGIRNVSFSTANYAGPLDALDVVNHNPALNPLSDRPLHLDAYPTAGILSTANPAAWNVNLTGYISGAAPGAVLAILGSLVLVPPGGFVPRYDVSPFLPGYPDLYIDPFQIANQACVLSPPIPPFTIACQIPVVQSLMSSNPVLVWTDPVNGAQNGDTCFTLNLNVVLPPSTLPFTPPPLIIFQAMDLSAVRLSDPLSFQLN